MRGRAWIVALCLLAAGCGGHDQSRPRAAKHAKPAPALDGCVRAGPDVRLTALSGHGQPDAAILGHGARGAVFSNQGDQNLCAWLPFARRLERAGMSVLLSDNFGAVLESARALRRAGARRVVAIGASVGARASLAAAAHPHGLLDGVISLSAERFGSTVMPDILRAVKRLRLPVLFIATRHDPYAQGDAPVLYRAARSHTKRILVLPGDAHGTAMLQRRSVRALVMRFAEKV